jgi:hypothetical protein
MKHLMPNDPRHEISRSTGGHFKRRHKRSPHRSRDVPLSLHCQHRQCSLDIPLRPGGIENATHNTLERKPGHGGDKYPTFLSNVKITSLRTAVHWR